VPYDLGTFFSGIPTASQFQRLAIVRNVKIPAGASGTVCLAKAAATGSTTFTIKKVSGGVPTSIGTLLWSASGTSCAVTWSSDISFANGDIIEWDAPSSADATLSDIAVTIPGIRQ
jgi:hypothetical protein